MSTIVVTDLPTPVGALRLASRAGTLVGLAFADRFDRVEGRVRRRFPDADWSAGSAAGADAVRAYVAGDPEALAEVAVDTAGTPFQEQVWVELRAIPPGQTRSYGDIAAAVGNPGAVRAVGTANGANPVWLVVPCHRIIRSDGTLGGYGGGLDRKRWLLDLEGSLPL